jgi:hypothetical protein
MYISCGLHRNSSWDSTPLQKILAPKPLLIIIRACKGEFLYYPLQAESGVILRKVNANHAHSPSDRPSVLQQPMPRAGHPYTTMIF